MAAIQTRTHYVLPVYESLLGDHPFVATTLSWIAFSYQALGDYDNAIKFTQRALEIRQQLLGHHKETARSFYDLGVALAAKQDYERLEVQFVELSGIGVPPTLKEENNDRVQFYARHPLSTKLNDSLV